MLSFVGSMDDGWKAAEARVIDTVQHMAEDPLGALPGLCAACPKFPPRGAHGCAKANVQSLSRPSRGSCDVQGFAKGSRRPKRKPSIPKHSRAAVLRSWLTIISRQSRMSGRHRVADAGTGLMWRLPMRSSCALPTPPHVSFPAPGLVSPPTRGCWNVPTPSSQRLASQEAPEFSPFPRSSPSRFPPAAQRPRCDGAVDPNGTKGWLCHPKLEASAGKGACENASGSVEFDLKP